MSSLDTYANTLDQYGCFSVDVIDAVVDLKHRMQYQALDSVLSRAESGRLFRQGQSHLESAKRGDAWLYDSGEHDDTESVELHYPGIGNAMNIHNITKLQMLSEADPTTRILCAGYPGTPFLYSTGRLEGWDQLRQTASGDLSLLASKLLAQAQRRGVDAASAVGYSLGAELAVTASTQEEIDVDIKHLGLFEAPATGLGSRALLKGFARSGRTIDDYLEQSDIELYQDAQLEDERRELCLTDKKIGIGFTAGLLRATNLAAGLSFRNGSFWDRLDAALLRPKLESGHLLWGSASEVSDFESIDRYVLQNRDERLEFATAIGMGHAAVNDPLLSIAMVLESRRKHTVD